MTQLSQLSQLTTSLAEIHSFHPCAAGWRAILKGQNKTQVDDVLFPLIDCVESNSFSDVCWLLGKRKVEIDICVKVASMCAKSVEHLKNRFSSAASATAAAATAALANISATAIATATADTAADAVAATADAASAAASAAIAATGIIGDYDYAIDAEAAYAAQKEKNKQFFREAILAFEAIN